MRLKQAMGAKAEGGGETEVKGPKQPNGTRKEALLARRGPLQSVEERAAEPPSCLVTYRKASAAWSPTDSTSYLTTNRTLSRY